MESTPRFRVAPLPRPTGMVGERRHRRSSSAAMAIELAFTCAAERAGLDVVLLVDDAGMLVAGSRTSLDLSMLAAVTPIVGRGQAIPRIKRDGKPRDMSVAPICLGGEQFYLAVVGGHLRERRRELGESVAAATRILA